MKKLNEIKKQVEDLLDENETLRNDDLALIFEYWNRFDNIGIKNPPKVATSPATIIRVRAKIQTEGKYPPTDPIVRERRRKRQHKVRTWIVEGTE
jgi:hypothetical protein